jgi:peptidoglycan hydrolase-like protein with peptidoglycan-binding domain
VSHSTSTSPPSSEPTTTPATTATPNSTAQLPAATTSPAQAPRLEPGSTGPAVLALQERLSTLHFWLGTPDGKFGDSTEQAVYAFQKAAGLVRDGVVGAQTEAALRQPVEPQPRSRSGYVIEIDLSDDLMMFVTNGRLDYVLNTSTGGGYTYTTDGETAVADTPVGVFHISRQVDGLVTDSLGQLWRPKFFYSGFAIHGDGYVPPYPVSHGCARVSNEAIDWIWATSRAPIGTEVWVY